MIQPTMLNWNFCECRVIPMLLYVVVCFECCRSLSNPREQHRNMHNIASTSKDSSTGTHILTGEEYYELEPQIPSKGYNDFTLQPGWVDPFDMINTMAPQKHYNEKIVCSGSLCKDSVNIYSSRKLLNHDNDNQAPQPGWIDPFDVLGEKFPPGSLNVQSEIEISGLKKQLNKLENLMKRVVNIFIRPITKDNIIEPVNVIDLQFFIDEDDFKVLRDFGELGEQHINVDKVSKVLDKIMKQPNYQQQKHYFGFGQLSKLLETAIAGVARSPEWTVVIIVSSLVIMTMWSMYQTQSYRSGIALLLIIIFIGGFGFNWMRMYEEEEAKRILEMNIHGDAPKHCSGNRMEWYEHIWYRMFGADCTQFYKTKYVRPIVKISPSDVLAVTVSSMIIIPACDIGKAYGNFVSGTLDSLPWYLKAFALIPAFGIPPIFCLYILTIMLNYRVSLSITGIHIIPDWFRGNIVNKPTEQYIEDISSKNEKNTASHNSVSSLLVNDNAPVYLMNFTGLKKIISESLKKDNDSNIGRLEDSNNERKESSDTNEDTYVPDSNENSSECLLALNSLEQMSGSQIRKTKTFYTSVEGNSLNNIVKEDSDVKYLSSSGDRDESVCKHLDNKTKVK